MTAARFFDLLDRVGIDVYYRAGDGRIVFRAPRGVLDDLRPKLALIGAEAIRNEYDRRAAESRARLAALLGPMHPAVRHIPITNDAKSSGGTE